MKPNEAVAPQPPPTPNERPHIADLVIEDIRARKAEGVRKYGTPLQAGNGRDALIDAYEEALDLAQYLKQAMEEQRERWVADAIASHERIFGSNRNQEVKHEPDTQVPIVEVAAEAGEALYEAHSDQAHTRSDQVGRGVPEVQTQAHRSSVVAAAEREDSLRREGMMRVVDGMNSLSGSEVKAAMKAREDKLRREGAVAALRAFWVQSATYNPIVFADRIEAGEVMPWAKK